MINSSANHFAIFHHLYTHAPIGVSIVSPENGAWIMINPAFCSMLGYTENELLELSYADITCPEDRDASCCKRMIKQLACSGDAVYKSEKRFIHKQGRIIWGAQHVSLVCEENTDRPLYLIVQLVDITEQKAIEQELRENQELHLLMTKNMHDLISYSTPDGTIRYISPSVKHLLGFEQEELVGKKRIEFYHAADAEQMRQPSKLFSDSDVFTRRIRHKDGHYLWFETSFQLVRDVHGNVEKVLAIGRNITERKRMEDKLRESEKTYRLISENSLDFISRHAVNKKANFLYASPACLSLLGYEPEELVGQSALRYIHPEDVETVRRYLTKNLFAKSRGAITYRFRRKDGSYIWFETTSRFTYDEQDRLQEIVAISRDITERRESELRLRESEHRYKSLFENNPLGVYALDREGRFLSSNARAEVLTGYTKEELIGTSFEPLIDPAEFPRAFGHFGLALQGHPQTFEIRIISKDGRSLETSITNVPIVVGGQTVGVYGIISDITERKRYVEQIEKLSYEYTLILNSVSEGIIGLDIDGKGIFINPAGATMLGYSSEELLGHSYLSMIQQTRPDGSHYPPEESPIFLAVREGRYHQSMEAVFWRKDGSSILVAYRITPLFDRGSRKGAVIVFQDITNEREILRAKESAEQADRAKSEFLAIMSHELRTPMNGIIGMADLLSETSLSEEQHNYLDIISQSSYALLHILNEILDFSKIEAGRMVLSHEPIPVETTLEGVMDLFAARAAEKSIGLTCSIDPAIPPIIMGDAARLRQVLVNLVGNAIKFTETGSIAVSIKLSAIQNSEGLVLEFFISDTGIGIPQDKQDQLFQSFSQLHPAINRKYGGTGLGLAICKKLVELMGGFIDVESKEGVGSTFHFTLQFDTADAEDNVFDEDEAEEKSPPLSAEKRQTAVHALYGPLKLLVVEDNPVNQQLFRAMLKRLGYEADIAESGLEAVQAATRQTYDLIFMDIQMPGMDGIEATNMIRQRLTVEKAPVIIAVTAFAGSEDKELCLSGGMQDFIGKPVLFSEVERVLKHWSGRLPDRQ